MEFSVESYTVAMHSSGTNQWPNITRNDIIVVTANVCDTFLCTSTRRLESTDAP